MFMCVELMLNAVNLTFVALATQLGDINGQTAVFFVMVVAAAEVVVGLGIIVVDPAPPPRRHRRRPRGIEGLTPWLDLVWLIPAFPLAGFLLILLFGRRLGDPKAGYLATTMVFASFVSRSLRVLRPAVDAVRGAQHRRRRCSRGCRSARFQVDLAFLADPLSITMCLFVTGIGALIHLYAVGYMHGDPKFSKFFLYLNLFVFSMTLLVLGENLLVTFLGWEGVGTCSYFLIAFWHTRESAATAGKKAFVTNRVGDWGFMLAMFLAFSAVGSLSYSVLNESAETGELAASTATAIALLLLIGADGKSAQLPLYLWLPDAMEGPTPVSALIHAATMVTAGVFLMTRINPVIAASYDWVPTTIAWRRCASRRCSRPRSPSPRTTSRRCSPTRRSASSATCSSPSAPAAYVAAIFHMVTHACFKALLFLGAGSVIHGMHDEQDMRKMGALRKFMPITAGTFIVGWLAIAGVPPFSGFWSKDEILLFALAESPRAVRRRPRHGDPHRVLHDPSGDHGVLRRGQVDQPGQRGRGSRGRRRRGARRDAPRPRRVQAARVAADHVDPARGAGRARRARRSAQPAHCSGSRAVSHYDSSTGSSR